MAEERTQVPLSALARWIGVAIVLLLGLAGYFWLAPRTAPLAPPAAREAAP
jgi:hypothetical protein